MLSQGRFHWINQSLDISHIELGNYLLIYWVLSMTCKNQSFFLAKFLMHHQTLVTDITSVASLTQAVETCVDLKIIWILLIDTEEWQVSSDEADNVLDSLYCGLCDCMMWVYQWNINNINYSRHYLHLHDVLLFSQEDSQIFCRKLTQFALVFAL